MMMNAADARKMTEELRAADDQEREERIKEFVEDTCDKAVKEEINKRRFWAKVSVPRDMNANDVADELRRHGYTAQITYGLPSKINIGW